MHATSFLARLAPLVAPLLLVGTLHSSLISAAPGQPPLEKRYAPGWCGVHLTQHQKNEPDNQGPNYKFDIHIFDADKHEIGTRIGADAPGGQGVGVPSQLPYVLILTAGNVDSDPVTFDYAGAHWASNGGTCGWGGYENGRREGDCGFTCKEYLGECYKGRENCRKIDLWMSIRA